MPSTSSRSRSRNRTRSSENINPEEREKRQKIEEYVKAVRTFRRSVEKLLRKNPSNRIRNMTQRINRNGNQAPQSYRNNVARLRTELNDPYRLSRECAALYGGLIMRGYYKDPNANESHKEWAGLRGKLDDFAISLGLSRLEIFSR